jgi:hypothetical protein
MNNYVLAERLEILSVSSSRGVPYVRNGDPWLVEKFCKPRIAIRWPADRNDVVDKLRKRISHILPMVR